MSHDRKRRVVAIAALALLLAAAFGMSGSGGNFDIPWYSIDGGGGSSSGSVYTVDGVIGQHDAGPVMTGGAFELAGGFMPARIPPETGDPAILTDLAVLGTIVSGGLPEIVESDDAHLTVRSVPGFQAQEPAIVHLTVGAESPIASPATIDLSYEGRISQPGGTVKIELKNWSSGLFEQVDAFAIGMTEETHVTPDIANSNYVRASDNRIEVRYRIIVVNLFQIVGFTSYTDQIAISVNE